MVRVHRIAQRALVGIGFDTHDEHGVTAREGMHTLRRSGARALFNELVLEGYDGALRTVQSYLHHSSSTMTERYLGLAEDRHRRNKEFVGRNLYPSLAQGVIRIGEDGHGSSQDGSVGVRRLRSAQ